MKAKDINIIKKILVSESYRNLFDVDGLSGYDIEFTDDFKENIVNVLYENKNNVIFTVMIINPDQYKGIYKLMNLIDYSRIYYQLVIIDDSGVINLEKLDRLYHISDITDSALPDFKKKFIVEKSFSIIDKHFQNEQKKRWYHNRLLDSQNDQDDLINIGQALSAEKDLEKLMRLILSLSKKMTGADAGSIYLVEDDEKGGKRLRFKYSHTYSREIPLEEFTMDLNKNSISGYVAVTGEVLNIPNAYEIDTMAPYSFNPFFDRENSYISRSMLVVPMKNHLDQIIGVIQLLNSKEDHSSRSHGNEAFTISLKTEADFDRYVVTFDEKYNSLLQAIAGQAAIAIENGRLIHQIQKQFEEFVKASVSAIESRDPATSGHSFRVAEICTAIAYEINDVVAGPMAQVHFSETDMKELEYAALLHDFGKVYIDLNIFRKAKKLYPRDLENLKLRLDYTYRFVELKYSTEINELLEKATETSSKQKINKLNTLKNQTLKRIEEIKEELVQLNEPALTDCEPVERLKSILDELEEIECLDISGAPIEVITDENILNLSTRKGSLNPVERSEIESHVTETYKFVSKIPWPPEYKNIPEIALRHHEKLDGTGYPDGLKGRNSISLQSRIMAIADIFDALTAQDRPYKKSVPLDKVLKILKEEAESDKVDQDIVDVFISRRVYEKISNPTHA